jgi:hypothetical protein
MEVGGLPTTAVPETRVQRTASVAYEGLKTVVRGLSDCSDMFPPLKTATQGLLTIIDIVEVSGSMYNARS